MNTPLSDFAERYAEGEPLRLHMPGHKGKGSLGVEKWDITEIDGADTLYSSRGIIAESQRSAAALFGAARTLYSTEGSSLCIRATVYLIAMEAKRRGARPRILAGRNAHSTFLSAAALVGAEVEWMYSEEGSMLSCSLSAEAVGRRIAAMSEKPSAVYLTCPDYLGGMADVEGIAAVCKKYGVILAVDNAHGAYLRFLEPSRHPMDLGADICCDSAHKTLGVLTGGAYLHLSKSAPETFFDAAEQAMALFASTSPSYLILKSLDMANATLAGDFGARLGRVASSLDALKTRLSDKGVPVVGEERVKLTLMPKAYGYLGCEIAEFLKSHGVFCEFYDRDFVTMMFTPEIGDDGIERVGRLLCSLERREAIDELPPRIPRGERVVSPRDAMLSPSRRIRVEDAEGRILASPSVSCPPAVPIIACGERIGKDAVKCFEYYGISECRVLEEK